MPHTKSKTVYYFDELSDKAKEKAREWYREGALDYEWWDYVYEDFQERAKELGVELATKPVKLMGGGTRYSPEIYFSGFYHQGQGSSFAGTWRYDAMNPDKLKSECPTEAELHRISDTLVEIANSLKEGESARCYIEIYRDTSIRTHAQIESEYLESLEYDSPEYKAYEKELKEKEEAIEECMEDLNRWLFRRLRDEYDYLISDEQVDESIRANEYEFTENGHRA